MAKPILTSDYLKKHIHYDPETGKFRWIKKRNGVDLSRDQAGSINQEGYRKIWVNGKCYAAHRLAFLYMTGEWPVEQVDHINNDRADNCWANLRQVSNHENRFNLAKHKKKTVGIYRTKRGWLAGIRVNGYQHWLGTFERLEDAIKVRREAADKHFVIPDRPHHIGPPQGGF